MPVTVVDIFGPSGFEAAIAEAVHVLDGGGIVLLPTETVYGAAGRIDRPDAVARLRSIRPAAEPRPLIPHLGDRAIEPYVGVPSELGRRLVRKLWPGPVGLSFPVDGDRRAAVAGKFQLAESDLFDDGRITLRCPDHEAAEAVLAAAGGPVAVTMAGSGFGGPTFHPPSAAVELEGLVDFILDAGPTRFNKPSTLLHVDGEQFTIVRAGVYDERIIDRMLKTTVLFVCSGNTCRSPMAEALARTALAKKLDVTEADLDRKGINVVSAGTYAMPGSRATPQAADAVRGLGSDLSKHRSRPLTVELIHQADRIYAMGRSHAQIVRALVPSASEKVVTLDPDGDIEDPIGSDLAVYQHLAGNLQKLIARRLDEHKIA